jgi:hypothetical protein
MGREGKWGKVVLVLVRGCDMINVGGRGSCDVMLRDSIKVVYIVDLQLTCK